MLHKTAASVCLQNSGRAVTSIVGKQQRGFPAHGMSCVRLVACSRAALRMWPSSGLMGKVRAPSIRPSLCETATAVRRNGWQHFGSESANTLTEIQHPCALLLAAESRHSRAGLHEYPAGGNPDFLSVQSWIPTFAGMMLFRSATLGGWC